MKNLKKVLALVVVFTMMLGTVAFASYPDVAEDAAYATAVDTLSALSVLKGDDKGNFNPDQTITRAEFAAVVCRALGLENSANGAKGATMFADVAASHWATGYINLASQAGIINGYGDGNFGPEAPVTYEQAVKMLVSALGYDLMATSKGGYPGGYLVTASQIGLTKGVKATAGDAAARSLVAMLTYNALDLPIMEQTGYGTEVTYEIQDGSGNKDRKTLLSEKLNVVKLGGIISATSAGFVSGTGFASAATSSQDDVVLSFNENYKYENNATTSVWHLTTNSNGDYNYKAKTVEVGDTNANDYLGKRVVAFVQEISTNRYELVAIVADEGQKVTTISFDDVDTGKTDLTTALYYYKDSASKSTKLSLASSFGTMWNYGAAPATSAMISAFGSQTGVIELLDWDNNSEYDIMIVKQHGHVIVDSVDADRARIFDTYGRKIDLDKNEDATIIIKNLKGDALELADIEEGDILAIISDASNYTIPSGYTDYIEITVLPGADYTVTGAVTEKDTKNDIVYVDGTAYEATSAMVSSLGLKDEGKFFLSIGKSIFDFDGDEAKKGNYGYIVGSGYEATEQIYKIVMVTEEGESKTFEVDSKVRFDTSASATAYKMAETVPTLTGTLNTWKANCGETITTVGDLIKSFGASTYGVYTSESAATTSTTTMNAAASRLVKYLTNASGEITAIEGLADYATTASGEYSADKVKLGTKYLADETVVFSLDYTDYRDTTVKSVASLIDDSTYKFGTADKDDGIYGVVILFAGESAIDYEENMAVVTSISSITGRDDEPATKVTYLKGGEEGSVIFNSESDAAMTGAYSTLTVGSVFMFSADEETYVEKYIVVATMGTNGMLTLVNSSFSNDAEDANVYKLYAIDTLDGKAGIIDAKAYTAPTTLSSTVEEIKYLNVKNLTTYYFNTTGRDDVVEAYEFNSGSVGSKEAVTGGTEYSIFMARTVGGEVVELYSLEDTVLIPQIIA